jgi:hypothetical protein
MNGQQTETHLGALPLVSTVAVLVPSAPPVSVPGSPLPVSPEVPYQSSGIWKTVVLAGLAVSVIVPSGTQTVWEAAVEAAPPLIVTLHQLSKLSTVRATGVEPLHVVVLPPVPLVLDVAFVEVDVACVAVEDPPPPVLLALPPMPPVPVVAVDEDLPPVEEVDLPVLVLVVEDAMPPVPFVVAPPVLLPHAASARVERLRTQNQVTRCMRSPFRLKKNA